MDRIPVYLIPSYRDSLYELQRDEKACKDIFLNSLKKHLPKVKGKKDASYYKRFIRENKFVLGYAGRENIAKGYEGLISYYAYKEDCVNLIASINAFLMDLQASSSLQRAVNSSKLFSILSIAFEDYLDYRNKKIIESIEELNKRAKEALYIEDDFSDLIEIGDKLSPAEFLRVEREDYYAIKDAYDLYKKNPSEANRKRLLGKINSYIVKYARYPQTRYRNYVEEIIEVLSHEEPKETLEDFIKNLKGIPKWEAAKRIYEKMIEILREGNFQGFMRLLGVYGHITATMPDAPYRKQVDELEEKIYTMIEEKNLWDKIA